ENGSTAYATSQADRLVSECPAFSALVELQVLEALAPAGLAEPEIEFADIVVAAQRVGRALEDDPAVLHHVAVVGDAQGDLGVLLDQEERRPALDVDLADDVEDLAQEQGREPECRLVKQEELGPGHEGAADDEHLLLTAAQVSGDLAAARHENREVVVDHLEILLDAVGVAPCVAADAE